MFQAISKICILIFFFRIGFSQSDGYLLISNRDFDQNNFTALISNDYQIFHQWDHPSEVHSTAYLNQDSTLIVPLVIDNPIMPIYQKPGGRFQQLKWNNEIIWDFFYFDTLYTPHHDIEPLPNGNILVICWEKKSMEEAISQGRQNIYGDIWPTMIVELQPPLGIVVWEWHLWDHLIQDINPDYPNYGNIADHPELFNINLGNPVSNVNGDWLHVNAIDYNEELDQIIFSSRHMNEIYIIDHSTTSEEAASHSGGNSGKGGDFLYRWGNPMNYNQGTNYDTRIIAPHAVNWIDKNFPGYGNILIFNNNPETGNYGVSSEVIEITPPIDIYGNYSLDDEFKFGPDSVLWSHGGDSSFYSGWQSSAYRLSNGNTLITSSQERYIFEVDNENNILWQCHSGGNLGLFGYPLRTIKIEPDFFLDKADENFIREYKLYDNYPNPFNPSTTLQYNLPNDEYVTITIYDILGNVVNNLVNKYMSAGYNSIQWHGSDNKGQQVSSGVYFYIIEAGDFIQTRKMALIK